MIFQGQALSNEHKWKQLSCTTSKMGSKITIKINWSHIRSFRIINGADYFDARQENNAINFEMTTNSNRLIEISSKEGFSYFDEDNSSLIIGKTNEAYVDLLNLEIVLESSNTLKGKIYLMDENNKMTEEDVECKT
jgi:hypothetical protein